MAYSQITQEGENFIKTVCEKGMKPDSKGNTLLRGKNTYKFPFSNPPYDTQEWVCNIVHNGKTVTTATELATMLIDTFNKYSKVNEMDANIIAAQSYVECGYKMWNYAGGDSTASGVAQYIMTTVFAKFVEKYNRLPDSSDTAISKQDTAIITKGMKNPLEKFSYYVNGAQKDIARENRPILHQNIINNPQIMIKSQCEYMRRISDDCDSIASTALFCYNRGPAFVAKTYSDAIQKCKRDMGENYIQEGLNYVLRIFGILGDKDNNLLAGKGLGKYYKPMGVYFGYDDKYFPGNNPKNLKLGESWNAFNANVNESEKYTAPPAGTTMISKYVTYADATKCPNKNINNVPDSIQLEYMKNLAVNIYDKVVDYYKVMPYITSFFRGQQYNDDLARRNAEKYKKPVKIPTSSNHIKGFAMDIDFDGSDGKPKALDVNASIPTNGELFYFIVHQLKDFDAVIWEVNLSTNKNPCSSPSWVHAQYKASGNRKVLSIIVPSLGIDYSTTSLTDFEKMKKDIFKC